MRNINQKDIEKLKAIAETFFSNASGCHDWTHVERVHNMAQRIGQEEGANLELLSVASYLHDIGRSMEMKEKGKFCHAERGAELTVDILKNFDFDQVFKDNIIHCILTHRYRNNLIPTTLEAKVLFDSDKLDSIGAVGLGRAFIFAGNAGSNTLYNGEEKELADSDVDYSYTNKDSCFLEYEIKLKYIYQKMLTDTGRKLAIERDKFMKKYIDQFWNEVNGIK